MVQEITGEDYTVLYDPTAATIRFAGEMALSGLQAYEPITNLLRHSIEANPKVITLDLRKLAFLNSSGISMISKFVLSLRRKKEIQLVVLGSKQMPWQSKSLRNLPKFLPGLQLDIE